METTEPPHPLPHPAAAEASGPPGEKNARTGSAGRGHPFALSPSRAGDFMQCPLLYRFRVVDRLPEPPSAAATRGTLVHAVLERLFDLPAGQRTLEQARELVAPQWQRLLADNPELAELFTGAGGTDSTGRPDPASAAAELADWLAGAGKLLSTYFTLEDPNRLQPAERELYVETQLDSGLVLRGYVDRLDIAPGGDMRVVDYKTGRAPGPAFEGKALFQMKFYALVLWRLRGQVPRRLQLIYLGSGDVIRYDPVAADLEATERKIRALWTAIEQALRSGQWTPKRSKLCGWCHHQSLCPEFGGTPPPLAPVVPEAAPR